MEPIPKLEIGWLNGWILIALLYLTYGILLVVFPKDVVARLYGYDRSSWTKTERAFAAMRKSLAVAYFALITFSPLKIGSNLFIAGIILYTIGLPAFVIALLNFRNTPFDQPATRGFYRMSRHPQALMFYVSFLGICLAIGSWLALFLTIVLSLFVHSRNLTEEKACLEKYGDSYCAYMKRVPRYSLFVVEAIAIVALIYMLAQFVAP